MTCLHFETAPERRGARNFDHARLILLIAG